MPLDRSEDKPDAKCGAAKVDSPLPFRTRWDTSYVPAPERFSYFREGVCQAFFAYSPLPPADNGLSAIIDMATLDSGVVSKIDTTPLEVTRTATDFSRIPGNFYSLGWTQTGGLEGIAGGKPFVQEKDQLTLVTVDAIQSFDLAPHDRYSTVALLFDKTQLRDVGADHRFLILNRRHDAALASCVRLIGEAFDRASRPELNCLMDAAICLLNARLVQDPDFFEEAAQDSSVSQGLLCAIKDFAVQNIADAELTTQRVAHHFGISPRYIQKLFATEDATFKGFVVCLRLDRVARDLADPNVAKFALADVAFRWGFRDMATFHRNFRRRFDETPNQMRMRHGHFRRGSR